MRRFLAVWGVLALLAAPSGGHAQRTTTHITTASIDTLRSGGATVWTITGTDIALRLEVLAGEQLAGRRTGERGAELASEYIRNEFRRVGLSPADSLHTYFQDFQFSEHALDTNRHALTNARNVMGFIHGDDAELSKEWVVIGAHYDHLGLGGPNALDSVHAIHYGADDNASGTAALLEIAEHLSRDRFMVKRSILFIAFSGEEEGLFGSDYFVNHPTIPMDKIVAMLNMDMVGRMKDSTLIVQGTGTSPQWNSIIGDAAKGSWMTLRQVASGRGPSDHAKFYSKNLPVLFFFTGFHSDYHKASDTRDKINLEGENEIAQFVERIAVNLANRSSKIQYTHVATDTGTTTGAGFSVYVGGVPDYGYDGDGVKISEVTDGSPAQKAGFLKDDVIVDFDGMSIKTIYDYTAALGKHKPDQVVQVGLKRNGLRITVPLTLGRRSSSH